MEVVGEAVLSALLEPLFGKLTSGELLKFARKKDVEKELKKWKSRLFEINAVLKDAEQKQITSLAVKNWLSKLRDLAYDVEDVLDEFQTEALISKFKAESRSNSTSIARRLIPTCYASLKPPGVMQNVKKGSKLQEITVMLDEIVKEKNNLDLKINAGGRPSGVQRRVTTSLVNESDVFGRETDKEAIVKLLMRSEASDSRFFVIPIIGIGGVGKTTLAQLVYNDAGEKFDYKAWVCVSDDFDIVRITKTILHWDSCEVNDLNKLQELLKEKLSGKKFLIVLDDVWSKNYEDWTTLSVPFAAGELGSKIIITTRSENVASKMGSARGYTLEKLSSDECLRIFTKHALDARSFDTHSHLKDIAGKIAERCMGLPLAAKTLGGLLRHKQNLRDWENILNSEIWDLSEEDSGILPALKLSYYDLPSHLKQCFAYCSIFPKDYEFDENELVLLWMAEGFLHQQERKKTAADLGREYFHELSSRLLFQRSSMNKSKYVMHALIADLARFVSQETCFNLDDSWKGGSIHEQSKLESAKIRHSAFFCHRYDILKRFEVYHEMKSLRTFLALPISSSPENYFYYLSSKVLTVLVHKLKRLRVLSLAGYSLVDLPSSIGALKHLRYLDLSYTAVTRLPKSLSGLFNLQTLKLHGCSELVELPTDIGNLINLQYLDISDTNSLQEMPLQISKLMNLRLLPKFIVGKHLGIKELMKLSHLQGLLRVTGLHNVVNIRDAELSGLQEKVGLEVLALEWIDNFQGSRSGRDELHVLGSLRPHRSVKKLSIVSYGGNMFPSWVGDPSFTEMVDLQLCNCRKIISLPPLGKLPVLRHLSIRGMDEVKEVAIEDFPSLETLIIEDMLGWEQWSWPNDVNEVAAGKFPKLRELTLGNCPRLIGKLPSYLPSLQKLDVYNCLQLTGLPEMLPCLRELNVGECQGEIFRNVPVLSSLTSLKIRRVSGLVNLSEAFIQASVALQDLKMEDCNELMWLWQDGTNLDSLANLKHLRICYCEQLVSLVEGEEGLLPHNLEVLQVTGCNNLEKLPNGLHRLGSLRELEICRCPKLVSFPETASLPRALKRLEINECVSLEYLPSGIMTMTDHENSSNQCLLEELWILECPSLKSFPRGKVPTTLKSLYIWGCQSIESLPKGILSYDRKGMSFSHLEDLSIDNLSISSFPDADFPVSLKTLHIFNCNSQSLPSISSFSNLTDLNISYCPELESFPEHELPLHNLTSFTIWDCEKLRSLPGHMDKLTSLQDLSIQNCHSLTSLSESGLPPNLTSLTMRYCKNLPPMLGWRLRTLTSLKHLELGGNNPCTDVDYFPDDDGLLLPTSLTSLWITNLKNLKSISSGIHKLTFIEELKIGSCAKLQFLPKERFPATLGRLLIRSCPLLEQRCLKEKGDYWPIIAPIPYVEIDGWLLPHMKE